MRRASVLGWALVAALLSSCAAGLQESRSGLEGTWQLDPNRSDSYSRFMNDFGTTGDWNSEQDGDDVYRDDGDRDDRYRETARTRNRGWRLPDVFHIDTEGDRVRIEDSQGVLIEEIVAADDDGDRYPRRRGNVHARWRSDGQLQVDRTMRNDRRVTQTFTVTDRGRRLVVETQISGGDRRDRTIRREYDRG